jgi:hypothetical protein
LNSGENFEIGRKPISNPKSEISNWTRTVTPPSLKTAGTILGVQSAISDFGFEMGFRPISNSLRLSARGFINN